MKPTHLPSLSLHRRIASGRRPRVWSQVWPVLVSILGCIAVGAMLALGIRS